ncbi:hypothetical protein JCM1840_001083 [Sporobolomyces johnsonii]
MELPITNAGRRSSALADTTLSHSPRLDSGSTFNGPSSPRLDQNPPRMSNTPRLSSTPSRHNRKSSASAQFGQSPEKRGFWSGLLGGNRGKRESRDTPTLPTYGQRLSSAPQRPFYSDEGGGRGPLVLVRNILLRPLYVLGRRGPLFPIFGFLVLFFIFAYSSSPSTQSVKRRMQGAVGPYIPQRAAEAINWRGGAGGAGGRGQAPLMGADDAMGGVGAPAAAIQRARQGKQQAQGRVKAKAHAALNALDIEDLPPTRKDSRIVLEEGKPHPIPALMKRARQQWDDLKARQSKTFGEAVREYVRRYGRRPPKGFDKWYAFAKAHKVLMIDEFDLIDEDLLIYRAFSPDVFRRRVDHLADEKVMDVTWTIRIANGQAIREGPLGHHDRAKGVVNLMERFVHYLPDMKIVYNGHDGARIAVAAEERIRLEGLVKQGKYDADKEPPFWPQEKGPFPHWGMPVFCPPDSAVREPGFEYGYTAPMESTGLEMSPLVEGSIGSLIADFKGYMNVCEAPHYRHTHATTSWVFGHHPTPVMPMFTPGVQVTFGDVHALIVEQLELEAKHDPTWEERPFTSLQWRGQTSGPLWEHNTPWQTTQRARLHLLSHQEDGVRNIIVTDEEDNMRSVEVPNYRVNPLFLDAGMVGPAVQCVQEDGTCDKMYELFQGYDKRISFDRASLYKYVLDVDGNSWSGRFRRLMLSNAAVVKATIFREFWTDWAIPWLHFIPMQVDYSDMWDIMAFFRGGINGEGAHDELGKIIALEGKEWVRQCYRWADLEAYQFRLMLEYGRLYTDEKEPGSNDFNGDENIDPQWNGPVRLQ